MGCLGQGNISRCNFLPLSAKQIVPTQPHETIPSSFLSPSLFPFPFSSFSSLLSSSPSSFCPSSIISSPFFGVYVCVCVCVCMLGIVPGTSYTSFSFDVVIGLVFCKDVSPVNKVCVCVCVCVIWLLLFWPYVCWGITGTSWRQSLKVSYPWGVITSLEAFQVVDMGLIVEKFSFLWSHLEWWIFCYWLHSNRDWWTIYYRHCYVSRQKKYHV